MKQNLVNSMDYPPKYDSVFDGKIQPQYSLQPPPEKTSRKYLKVLSAIDVEPFLFFCMLAYGVQIVTQQNLYQEKACLIISKQWNLTTNSVNCHYIAKLSNFTDLKDATQVMANDYKLYSTLIETIPSAIWSLFIGSWSDKYGRKVPMTFATLGMCFFVGITMLNSFFLTWPMTYLLFSGIPFALSGGIVTIFSCAYSHLSETTEPEHRVLRYGILEVSFLLGIPIGNVIGGELFEAYGYLAVFSTGIACFCTALVWSLLRIKEKPKVKWDFKNAFLDLFNWKNVLDNIRTSTKRRERHFRKEILLMIVSMTCFVACYMAVANISYFFTQKMYDWGVGQYSRVSTITSFSTTAIMMVSVPVLNKVLKLRDVSLGIIGVMSLILGNVAKAFAYHPWMYIGAYLLGVWSGLGPIAIRSRLSKLVEKEELGKVFSLLAACEALVPVFATLLYTEIYNASIDYFPGLTFLVAGAISVIPLAIFLWLVSVLRNEEYQLLRSEDQGPKMSNPSVQATIKEEANDVPIIIS